MGYGKDSFLGQPCLSTCVVYSWVLGIGDEFPNNMGRILCPNHHGTYSSGYPSKSTMNSRRKGNLFNGFVQEMNRHSLAGWKRTRPLRLWDKLDGSHSSKKLGLVGPAIGTPITNRVGTPGSAIWGARTRSRLPA